jgi:hypothetical protein
MNILRTTGKNLAKLEELNKGLIPLNRINLRDKLKLSNYYSRNLYETIEEYGSIDGDLILSGDFKCEVTNEVLNYNVTKYMDPFQVFIFLICKDNHLTLQETKLKLKSL